MNHTNPNQRNAIHFFLGKGILLSPELNEIKEEETDSLYSSLREKIKSEDFLVLTQKVIEAINKLDKIEVSWKDLEKAKVLSEKGKGEKLYSKFLNFLENPETPKIDAETETKKADSFNVNITYNYEEKSKKRVISDFVQFFNCRYKSIEKMLRNRAEIQNLTTINRIKGKQDRSTVSLIAMVNKKRITKNGNMILNVEDPTGSINILINKNKPGMFEQAKDIVLDEVMAIVGSNAENIVFANNIVWPDIPHKHLKKAPDEAYVVFLSDLHVGSKEFLGEDFNKFVKWINQEAGNEKQKEIASKVKYIFIVGDLIDGCGIYPNQDADLIIKDVEGQYAECAKVLAQIPNDIPLIICPGNHDAMRIAEPQPKLYEDFAKSIYGLPNAIMVSNPACVNIHASEDFSGFDILLYHGYSFDYFVANVDSIRSNGGYNRADLIMKFLLKRRHLAPTQTSTLYIPETNEDPLVIKKAPDFFVTGHIHKSIAANYKNTTLISGSCWQSKTEFQEKVGHNPEPSRVPLVNLNTREIKILRFGK